MKKLFFTFITIFTLNIALKGQIRFGIKGGVNSANIVIAPADPNFTQSRVTSFHAGVVADKKISKSISLQPNLLFSQKGCNLLNSLNGLTYDSRITLNYLELPINIQYHITDKFTIGVGSYLSYAFGGNKETLITSNSVNRTESRSVDFNNVFKRLDYGINLISEYEILEGFIISANYSLGFANINHNTSPETGKNNVLGLSLIKFFKNT
jgi:Outer membrane protein beta-barrel domain